VIKVFTNGCFDIIHAGHIDYLENSKRICQGDRLIIGLNSDESMRRIKREPFNKQEDRKKVLEALRIVDEVHIFEEDTPYELIKRIKPRYITKGGDYEPEDVVGRDLAQLKIMDTYPSESSTQLLEKIKTWLDTKEE
jgi:rfaE bifunctional protein nucleotidyltransferase chain/domain|tara:strand:+ start:429 stop:839 length:411 start_codon:yes stop_codon:yes gene_type:complete